MWVIYLVPLEPEEKTHMRSSESGARVRGDGRGRIRRRRMKDVFCFGTAIAITLAGSVRDARAATTFGLIRSVLRIEVTKPEGQAELLVVATNDAPVAG